MNMKRKNEIKHTIQKMEGLLEVALLTLTFFVIWKKFYPIGVFPRYFGRGKYVLSGVYFFLVAVIFYFDEGFKYGYLKLTDVLISQWISLLIVNFVTYFQLSLISNKMINVVPMIVLMGVEIVESLACCYLFTAFYHHFYTPRDMIMIYGNQNGVLLKAKMETRKDKYQIKKMISVKEGIETIKSVIPQYDAVVICDISSQMRNDIMKFCYDSGIRTYITPKISDIISGAAEKIHLFDTPLLLVRSAGLSYEQRFVKRSMDILLCGIAMLILWPLMLVVAIAIKVEDGGPIFYKQTRTTIYNREFEILKFRSMIVDAEKEGKSVPAIEHDSRITKVGHVIRPIRIDELPQIINILKGDMSIVGPRPERKEHVQKYSKKVPEFIFRSKVKGGLTGYAQIFGKYNTTAYDKLKLDLMYIENYSFLLDLKLILMTISILFKKESTEGFDKRLTQKKFIKMEETKKLKEGKESG